MPNSISPFRKSVTYLEDRIVYEWMLKMAAERQTDVSVIIREATSAYFVISEQPSARVANSEEIFEAKASKRAETKLWMVAEDIEPEEAHRRMVQKAGPIRIKDLAVALRRNQRNRH
jgi:hypothetical protein